MDSIIVKTLLIIEEKKVLCSGLTDTELYVLPMYRHRSLGSVVTNKHFVISHYFLNKHK
jgi:hypothetical protein